MASPSPSSVQHTLGECVIMFALLRVKDLIGVLVLVQPYGGEGVEHWTPFFNHLMERKEVDLRKAYFCGIPICKHR